MSDFFNRSTPRQQEIFRQVANQAGFAVENITGATFEAEVPVNISWSDSTGNYSRQVNQYLGRIINDAERQAMQTARLAQNVLNSNLPVRPGSNAGGAQGDSLGAQVQLPDTVPVPTRRPNYDPSQTRLASSGLENAANSTQAERNQRSQITSFRRNATNDTRVRISDPSNQIRGGILDALQSTAYAVVFPYTPTINLTSTANYTEESPTHSNYDYLFYQNSKIESINIEGQFSARNVTEADYVLAANHFFRTATKMFYGASSNRGLPPVVCRLSGHGQYQFNRVPVVIQSFNQSYPNDVDYISTSNGTRIPVLQSISITCKPLYSRAMASAFDYTSFASGAALTKGYI